MTVSLTGFCAESYSPARRFTEEEVHRGDAEARRRREGGTIRKFDDARGGLFYLRFSCGDLQSQPVHVPIDSIYRGFVRGDLGAVALHVAGQPDEQDFHILELYT